MGDIPEYSDGALAARDIFFTNLADVHLFVEDAERESLYERIFQKSFLRNRVFAIFSLRGKQNVLNHAFARYPVGARTKRVYVLDKDFDDLLSRQVDEPGVFYLDDYCIENALVDQQAIEELCLEERPRMGRAAIRGRLAYQQAIDEWMPRLDKLHRAFFLVQKYDLGIANCDLPPERFAKDNHPSILDDVKVENYIDDVAARLVHSGVLAAIEEYPTLSAAAFGNRKVHARHISGKFVVKLIFHYLRRLQFISNLRLDSMTMRFASTSRLLRLKQFNRRVSVFLGAT